MCVRDRRWPLLIIVLFAAAGVWLARGDDEPVAPGAPAPQPGAQAGAPADAPGPAAPAQPDEPSAADETAARELMRRWEQALQPIATGAAQDAGTERRSGAALD